MSISEEQWRELDECIYKDTPPFILEDSTNYDFINRLFKKGNKMNNVFEVLAVQKFTDTNPLPPILVTIEQLADIPPSLKDAQQETGSMNNW